MAEIPKKMNIFFYHERNLIIESIILA